MNRSETTKSTTVRLREALAKAGEDEQVAGIIAARDKVLLRYQAVFAPDHLPQLAEGEFKEFLHFENNHHWTGLERKGFSLCADMPRFREALTILLDESQPLSGRLDRLIPKAAPHFLPKFGKALITAILHVTHPDKYGVYNGTSEAGMEAVGVLPSFERGASFSDKYMAVNKTLNELASEVGIDLWTLDALWWLIKPKGASKRAKQTTSKPRPPGYIPKKLLAHLRKMNVRRNVERYIEGEGRYKGRNPDERYASFDYCFNYFRPFYEENRVSDICCPENIQQSCLQLAFYLASWGMLRGNTVLLQKSARFYTPLLESIVQLGGRLWEVDVDSYTDENIALLVEVGKVIREALGSETNASPTLVTKIMMGVYGNVPAIDRYVKKGLGVNGFSRKSLKVAAAFYECHKDTIDRLQQDIRTLDFRTGEETNRHYTKAKIVDMAAFIGGQ